MATLTCAELADYQAAFAHADAEQRSRPGPKRLGGPTALALPRFLDLRPFPGRNRAERIEGWLLSHVPRTASWSPETLSELAARIAESTDVVE